MQRGYVAIEIESLTVAWAVEKIHHFLYGCHFILEADQKPLKAILSRSHQPSHSVVTAYFGQDPAM